MRGCPSAVRSASYARIGHKAASGSLADGTPSVDIAKLSGDAVCGQLATGPERNSVSRNAWGVPVQWTTPVPRVVTADWPAGSRQAILTLSVGEPAGNRRNPANAPDRPPLATCRSSCGPRLAGFGESGRHLVRNRHGPRGRACRAPALKGCAAAICGLHRTSHRHHPPSDRGPRDSTLGRDPASGQVQAYRARAPTSSLNVTQESRGEHSGPRVAPLY